jgi:hypothetical protein
METLTIATREVQVPIRRLVVGWVTLLPILFFCVGGLIPETGSLELRKIATEASALSYRVPATIMALLCLGLAVLKYGAVLKSARRVKPLVFLTLAAHCRLSGQIILRSPACVRLSLSSVGQGA